MCTTTLFQRKDCGHVWAMVTEPCGPGMGFATCGSFSGGPVTTKQTPRLYRTSSRACPRCAEAAGLGAYDANAVRVVGSMGWGLKLGLGPDEDDWGVDVRFASRGAGCVVL